MSNVEPKAGDRVVVLIKDQKVEPALQRPRQGILKRWREPQQYEKRGCWIVKLEDFPQGEIWCSPEDIDRVIARPNPDGTVTTFDQGEA